MEEKEDEGRSRSVRRRKSRRRREVRGDMMSKDDGRRRRSGDLDVACLTSINMCT